MNKPPAFQFYADDFLGGTINFTDAEVGLYVRLLCVQWSAGSIEDSDEEIASYGKGGTRIDRVKAKFAKCDDGKLRNPRLELERSKQQAYRQSRAENGKHGGRPCKAHGNHVDLKTKAQESSPSPSPSPSPLSNSNTNPKVASLPAVDAFELHPNLDRPDFKAAWNRWHEHLKQKRKPATVHARDLQLAKLAKLGPDRAIQTINHSIEHNWQGLFEPQPNGANGSPVKVQAKYERCI